MLVRDAYKKAYEMLSENGADEARADARFLLSYYLDMPSAMLSVSRECVPDEKKFFEWVNRRLSGEPCAYITQRCEFMSLDMYVNENVLVPRQDTELLCELAIKQCGASDARVLDICTGSGCIAVAVAVYCKNADVSALDISQGALEVAEINADRNNVRICFSELDILSEMPTGKYNIILSNPPYIRTNVIDTLDTAVKDYEPVTALDGGADGLVFYRRIADISRGLLENGGSLMLETGFDQAEEVMAILGGYGYEDIRLYRDLSGNPRVVTAKWQTAEDNKI